MLINTLYRLNEISKRNSVPLLDVILPYSVSRIKVYFKELKETSGKSNSCYYSPFRKDNMIIRLTESLLDKSKLEKIKSLESI